MAYPKRYIVRYALYQEGKEMLYPETDYKEWSALYRIKPLEKTCPCCKKDFLTTVPLAIKGYRGLQTPDHGCGEEGFVSIFVPVDQQERDKWNQLLFG